MPRKFKKADTNINNLIIKLYNMEKNNDQNNHDNIKPTSYNILRQFKLIE